MKLRLLMVLIIAPTISLAAYYAAQLVEKGRQDVALAHAIYMGSVEKTLINDLIHELQKERGYSAGFIGSQRENFASELLQQRDATNARIDPVLHETPLTVARNQVEFDRIIKALEQLGNTRSQVDALGLTVPNMAVYYTNLIDDLLRFSHPAEGAGGAQHIAHLQAARVFVVAAKESAGLERAMGATGLGGGFETEIAERFFRFQGAQDALLKEAAYSLNDPSWSEAMYASDAFQALASARGLISEGRTSGDFDGLTAPDWFEVSTVWIDYLHDLELSLGEQIEGLAQAADAAAVAGLNNLFWVGVAALLLVAIIALSSFEYIIRRIRQLTKVVDGFAAGDFSQWVPGIKLNDEISSMARAIYKFKQETLALRREALEVKEAEEASLNAKHGRVVDLVTEGLAALAQADLSIRFEEELDDQYDQIRKDFNGSTQRLCDVLTEIIQIVRELGESSQKMNASALDLASRTTSQVETIRSTTEQVSVLSAEVNDFGSDVLAAASEAAEARTMATHSAQLMEQVDQAMGRIKGSSEEIGKIISMIDDIAFQTNLLALNAGVEAARAGPAGRGFAVVASEVGNLAQRASQATLDIKALVEDSGSHVNAGVELVDRTGASLGQISTKVRQVDDVLTRVSEGSKVQVTQLKQLADAMQEINALTGKNTIMADETQVASGDIASRSRQLADLIADFRLLPNARTTKAA